MNVCDFFNRRRRDAPQFYRRRLLTFITKKLEIKVKDEDEQALIEEAVRDMEINADEDEEKHQMLRSKSKREYEEEIITKEMELEDQAREEEKRKAMRVRFVKIATLRLLFGKAKKAFKRELKREIVETEKDWEDESEFVLDLRNEEEDDEGEMVEEEKKEDGIVEVEEKKKTWYYKFKDLREGMGVRVTDDVEHVKAECKRCTLRASGASTMFWGTRTQKERDRTNSIGQIGKILELDASDHSVCLKYGNVSAWLPASVLMPVEEEEEDGDDEEMPEPVFEDELVRSI